MTNAYSDIVTLKSSEVLNIAGKSYDTRLLKLLEAVSRLIDLYCNRHFYVLLATRKFDGDGASSLNVQDLISLTSLKTDDNVDRTFETTWASTDYLLYPPNADPTKEWGRPYTRVLVDAEAGSRKAFPAGLQAVEIAGKWGYREVTEDSGTYIKESAQYSATDTILTVADGSKFAPGQTILIGSEQIYLTVVWTDDMTVIRGVNGTTAAAHADRAGISICRYPRAVAEACLIQTAKMWRRKGEAFTGIVSSSSTQSLDPDMKRLLEHYRKPPVGVGT